MSSQRRLVVGLVLATVGIVAFSNAGAAQVTCPQWSYQFL